MKRERQRSSRAACCARRGLTLGLSLLLALPLACARPATQPAPRLLLGGDGLHGIHGLAVDASDRVYAGSVIGRAIYRIDTASGSAEVFVAGPEGEADDLEFAPDGTLVWTSFGAGKVHARRGDGPIRVLAEGLPGINSLAFDPKGRLFASRVFMGDALYEIDLRGERPARLVLEDLGGLNGFDFGPDGKLYGPLWFRGQVVRIDVDAPSVEVLAEGFQTPAAVNFDSRGQLFALDTGRGEIVRVDLETGARQVVAHTQTAMDNLAFDSRDRLYFTVFPENALYRLDPGAPRAQLVRDGEMGPAAGLALWAGGESEQLYLADIYTLRVIELPSLTTRSLARIFTTPLELASAGLGVNADFLFVASPASGRVQRLDRRSGEVLETLHGFRGPSDVLPLADGSLLVAERTSGTLRVQLPDGERKLVTSGLQGPVAVAPAAAGSAYVLSREGGTLHEVELASGALRLIAAGLVLPEALVVTPDGEILVLEEGARRIQSIDTVNGTRRTLAADLPLGLDATPSLAAGEPLSGLARGGDGTLYFSSDERDALYAIDPPRR